MTGEAAVAGSRSKRLAQILYSRHAYGQRKGRFGAEKVGHGHLTAVGVNSAFELTLGVETQVNLVDAQSRGAADSVSCSELAHGALDCGYLSRGDRVKFQSSGVRGLCSLLSLHLFALDALALQLFGRGAVDVGESEDDKAHQKEPD